jgi:hypothetical protein
VAQLVVTLRYVRPPIELGKLPISHAATFPTRQDSETRAYISLVALGERERERKIPETLRHTQWSRADLLFALLMPSNSATSSLKQSPDRPKLHGVHRYSLTFRRRIRGLTSSWVLPSVSDATPPPLRICRSYQQLCFREVNSSSMSVASLTRACSLARVAWYGLLPAELCRYGRQSSFVLVPSSPKLTLASRLLETRYTAVLQCVSCSLRCEAHTNCRIITCF